jgi:hypothetical protein
MKPLPKEFQFKCDAHSAEQIRKLGIIAITWTFQKQEQYYAVRENKVVDYFYEPFEELEIISLADYLEHNVESNYSEKPNSCPDHSDLIVELTGKYVIGGYDVPHAIKLAEETIKQLKEKGYLK